MLGSHHYRREVEETLEQDAADDGLRPLAEYLARWPDCEDIVRKAHQELSAAAEPPTPKIRTTESGPVDSEILDGPITSRSPTSSLAGTEIGPYRILRLLGRGGFGAVYLCEDTRVREHRVAVKILTRGLFDAGSARELRQEAEIASRLDDPGLCPVLNFDFDSDTPYLVLRYVEGVPLSERLVAARKSDDLDSFQWRPPTGDAESPPDDRSKARQKNWESTVHLIEKVARALHVAHESGVVHRDIKPDNIMVKPSGDPVILDFGIARNVFAATRTIDREVVGTVPYMSPEQLSVEGKFLDRRTDVFSLGVVLFECLTFRRPFDAPSEQALSHAIQQKDHPPLRELDGSLPPDLGIIVDNALDKDPARRYATALDLAEDLRRLREREPILARPVTRWVRLTRWAQRNPGVARSLALAFVILVAGTTVSAIQAARAEANFKQSEVNLGRANFNLRQWRRMADVRLLKDLQQEAKEELWPAWPEKLPLMASWLNRAEALKGRLPDHERFLETLREKALAPTEAEAQRDREDHPRYGELMELRWKQDVLPREIAALEKEADALEDQAEEKPELAARVARLQKDAAEKREELEGVSSGTSELEAVVSERRTWTFADDNDRYQHEVYANLVEEARALVADGGLLDDVTERETFAKALRRKSIEEEDAAWEAAIANVAKDSRFKGFQLRRQMGLVPQGPDPVSKLEEFWLYEDEGGRKLTGERPTRDPKSKELQITDTTGVVLVLIPGGTFTMGSQASDPEKPNHDPGSGSAEQPTHTVTLAPYFLSKYEVTQRQWSLLAGDNPSYWRPPVTRGLPITVRHPVESVSWSDCQEILPRAGLVLPTEAQWERACRAGTGTVYWCGDAVSSIQMKKAGNLADLTASKRTQWTCTTELEDGHVLHAPVGSFAPNAYGLHDVLGNVWEWCADGFDERSYDRPTREGDGLRLVWRARVRANRGGSFVDPAESARSAIRDSRTPDDRDNLLGCRPARHHF